MRTSLDREVWTTRLAFLRLAWKELLGASAVFVAGGVALLLVPLGAEGPRQVMAGALLASALWVPYLVTAMRTYNVTVGSWAEGWTRAALGHRALGWTVQDDLFLGGSNIDHIAVTQDDVLVVESKYRGYSKRPDRDRHARDVEQTRQNAKRMRRDLEAKGLDVVHVVPVLVVWGPGAVHLPAFPLDGQVQVVRGQDLSSWCAKRSNKRLVSLAQRQEIAQALADRRRAHDEWRARQTT